MHTKVWKHYHRKEVGNNKEEVVTWRPTKFIWNWGQNLEPNLLLKLHTRVFTTVPLGLSWIEIKSSITEEKALSQNIYVGIFKSHVSNEIGLVNTS